ncbi:MAG: hypothetical protein GWO41_02590 [candidate division Zixibacteria bacterium]|nr:hypothetical protein [candidate division Zixibacteria bacterium]NIR62455.1 hypothetical protein [candidate division Zixibacteria bacterium]NIS15155.1 hypothetical protein [candidate division Zixibacteria bacterium]NIS44597.1 hypothetical protein [candidate division Zixibacteria bacterium]NIT51652.1 hypothetical protein [candidate division Zixibacteria bacterium]
MDGKFLIYSSISHNDSAGKNGIWRIVPDGSREEQIFSGVAEHPKWSPDGRFIVFDGDFGKSIKMIPADGGKPLSIIPDSIGIMNGGLPCWSPDGSKIAFIAGATLNLCVADIKTGAIKKIFRMDGKIPMPGCWSRDGEHILIALMDRESRKSAMWKISSDGKEKKQINGHHQGLYRYIELSPDGSLIIYAAMEENELELWVMPAEGGKTMPLIVSHPGHNECPSWSPDGKRIAFTSTRSGNFDVWITDVNIDRIKKRLLVSTE